MFLNKFFKEIIFLISSLLLLICSLLYIFFYNSSEASFQFLIELNWFESYYLLGIDSILILFLFLTTFIMPLCLLFNWNLDKGLWFFFLENNFYLLSKHKYKQTKNNKFNVLFFNNKLYLRYFSTCINSSDNLDIININISDFEVLNYTVNNPIEFINFTENEKLNFCTTEFISQFINNISIQNIDFKNAKCYPLSDSFYYLTNNNLEPYFVEILEFQKNVINLSDKHYTLYTLCVMTNVSFLNVDLKTNSFVIKLFYINYIINDLTIELGEIYFSKDNYLKILDFFKTYFENNKKKDFLLFKVKKNILFLKTYKFLDAII